MMNSLEMLKEIFRSADDRVFERSKQDVSCRGESTRSVSSFFGRGSNPGTAAAQVARAQGGWGCGTLIRYGSTAMMGGNEVDVR